VLYDGNVDVSEILYGPMPEPTIATDETGGDTMVQCTLTSRGVLSGPDAHRLPEQCERANAVVTATVAGNTN